MRIEFPETVTYEVRAVRNGQVSNYARRTGYSEESSREMAAEFQAEADENYAMEARGPVKPIRTEYIVIRVTTKREVI